MYPISAKAQAALDSGSHLISFKFDVVRSGQPVASFNGRAMSGRVVMEKKSAVRSRLESLVIADPITSLTPSSLVPTSIDDAITTYGNEIIPSYGIGCYDGTIEYVPMGTFRLTRVEVSRSGPMQITCSGEDRSVNISRNTLLNPFATPAGVPLSQGIMRLLVDRYPTIQVSTTFSSFSTFIPTLSPTTPPLVVNEGSDAWQQARDMALGAGFELFFDRQGKAVMVFDRAVTAGLATPVASFIMGAQVTYTSAKRIMDDTQGYNVVVVSGSGSNLLGESPRAVAWDNDPSSPTYAGKYNDAAPSAQKPYGLSILRVSSPSVIDQQSAQQSARAWLARGMGPYESTQMEGVPWPHLDIDDVVTLVDTPTGITGNNWVIDSLSTPFSPKDKQTLTYRKQRNLR